MSRYIDLDRLIFCLDDEWAWHSKKSERGLRTAMQIVKEQPIADVVEVVRCKDCIRYHEEKGGWCELHDFEFDGNGYCCNGERRKEC